MAELDGMQTQTETNSNTATAPAPAPAAPATEAAPAPAGPSPEELAALKARAAKADENWERLLRATADFDNYKKRALREREDAVRYANESTMKKLVPVLDSFEMALAAAAPAGQSPAAPAHSLQTGIAMIFQQLKGALADAGLEEIDATGKPFDPNWHEAVTQQDSTEVPEGHVLQQIRRGFKLRDRLVRPALVIVARTPAT